MFVIFMNWCNFIFVIFFLAIHYIINIFIIFDTNNQMLYRSKNYYPQPQPLPQEYKYISPKFEMQLPLPGYSYKVPFEQKPTRFLTVNRRKQEIDYLRSHIMHKCEMQEMHYQAKLQQMRRQNQNGRMKLQKLLREQPTHLFAVPDPYIDEARSISSNLQNISLQRLYKNRNKYAMDSLDKIKNSNNNRNNASLQLEKSSNVNSNVNSESDSNNEQKQAQLKKQRQNDLDYIYKRNGAINTGSHFGEVPLIKKQEQKRKQKQKQKIQQIQWVQRVRAAKKFIQDDKQSVDSSKPSQSSQQKKKKKKQQQQEQKRQKAEQNSQRGGRTNINPNQNSRINLSNIFNPNSNSRSGQLNHHQAPSERYSRQQRSLERISERVSERESQRAPTREEDISNISQFSRYADRNDIFNKDKVKPKINMDAIPERDNDGDILPIMQRRRERGKAGNWKV